MLLVYKRSFLERHRDNPRVLTRMRALDRRHFRGADEANRRTLRFVQDELLRSGLRVDTIFRGGGSPRKGYDLIVTVGGDGTFFVASHFVAETPILGVNSDPDTSLGLHCGADAASFRRVLGALLDGRAKITALNRLSVEINGRRLASLVVNDVLFTRRNPAAMTRYELDVDGRAEEQRSSGLWISTASGSTAAIRAAGGRRMPLSSRRMQYLVREPYNWPIRPRLLRGEARRRIAVRCLVPEAAFWLDGGNTRVDLAFGDRAVLRNDATPLRVVNLDERKRARLFP